METIQVIRSFIAGDALAQVIARDYDLGPVTCKLFSKTLRTQDNDHYRVVTEKGENFVARVYQHGKRLERQESDYQYELEWLHYLHQQTMPVSYPIARKDGTFLGSVLAPEGLRYFALFSLAKGQPMSLKNEEHLYLCGVKMAEIHLASNGFKTTSERKPMNLEFLVDKPVERMKRLWGNNRPDELDILVTSAADARAEFQTLLDNPHSTTDSWGTIGGDFHQHSVHFDDKNHPTFFNFDLCGPGWRAYDIATFLLNTNLMHNPSSRYSEDFFAGYYSVRPLSNNEHEAIAPFITLRRVWLTAWFTLNDGLVGHSFIAPM